METRRHLLLLLLAALGLLATPALTHAQSWRTWTASDGRSIEGELKSFTDTEVKVLRRADVQVVSIPIDKLSEGDQAYVSGLQTDERRMKGLEEGAYAEMITGEFVRTTTAEGMPYQFWGSTKFKAGELYPLVLALHGGGSRGGDEDWPPGLAATNWTQEELQKERPCFVVAPRCPEDSSWRGEYGDYAAALVKDLADNLPIDRERIYVTGSSLGGSGSWYQIGSHRELFAGSVLMASGGPAGDAEKLKGFPIWQFHGELDPDSSVDGARKMAAAMKAAGSEQYKFTELKGAPHSVGNLVYPDVAVQEWLFAQRLKAAQ